MPQQSIFPRLLEASGGLRYPDDQAEHAENMRAAQDHFSNEKDPLALALLKRALLGPLGLNPEPGERVGDFWSRQYPKTMPPSMRKPAAHGDIDLPRKK